MNYFVGCYFAAISTYIVYMSEIIVDVFDDKVLFQVELNEHVSLIISISKAVFSYYSFSRSISNFDIEIAKNII